MWPTRIADYGVSQDMGLSALNPGNSQAKPEELVTLGLSEGVTWAKVRITRKKKRTFQEFKITGMETSVENTKSRSLGVGGAEWTGRVWVGVASQRMEGVISFEAS